MIFYGFLNTFATYTENNGNGVATLTHNADGTYTVHDEHALTETYDSTGAIQSVKDASGIGWTFSAGRVTHTNGQYLTIARQSTGTLTDNLTVTDPAGNSYVYGYGSELNTVTFPGTPATNISYKYISNGAWLSEIDYNGVPYAFTTYTSLSGNTPAGWANGTYLADNSQSTSIVYGVNAAGYRTATVTNPLGHVKTEVYGGPNGKISSVSNDAVADCGSTVNSTSYDAYYNPSQTVDNNGNIHTYIYAANGQLQTETEAYGTSLARTTDYTWDPNAQLNRLLTVTVEGWSKTAYTYNAQNRLASVAVTNLSGNGIANQTLTTTYNYTLYPNGMVHTLSVTHPSPGNTDTDVSTYDALGNLSSFANALGQTTTYSNYNGLGEVGRIVGPNGDTTDYTYDARGRVATKTTYPNGAAAVWNYAYDGFGLLANVSAPDNEVTTWSRNAEMQVTSVTHNDKDGTSTESFGYDANGDVTSDVVARGADVGKSETYLYDALGRLYQKGGNHGQTLTYGYDGNGNVISLANAAGHTASYQYDALNRLTKTVESGGASPPMPSTAPTLSAPANSGNGSYSVSWGGVSGATSYLVQQQLNGGSWSTVQSSSSTSFTLSNQSGGTYGYRVQACNATGCSPWSSTATVIVTHVTGNIDGVPIDGSGNASIGGWACSTGLTESISVDLYLGGPAGTGTFIGRYAANQSSEPAVASACNVSSGSYRYSIPLSTTTRSQYVGQAIYIHGISPIGTDNLLLANSGNFTVPVNEPAGAPSLSVPASTDVSYYTVSWSAVSGATSYTLQEQVNGGSWATVQSSAAASWGASGKSNGSYGYRAQACNSSGCSAWSVTGTITVSIPPIPAAAPALSVPGTNYTGSYTVSWGGVGGATSYTLQEQVNGGAWSTVQANGATSWSTSSRGIASYGYRAQACNVTGCGPWSGTSAVSVMAPASAPGLSVPGTNSTGSYTVSWSGVTGASNYVLQERLNSGGWMTVQNNVSTSWGASGKVNGSYGYWVQACDPVGCGPWSNIGTVTVTIPVPIAINGQSYTSSSYPGSTGGASAAIGFEITGGNTWEVFSSNQHVANTLVTSGTVPSGASTVQYTWTEVGLASGANLGGGTVTNGASTPTALSSNPSSNYYVAMGKNSSNIIGLTYQLTVTFYNAAGTNVSSSTCMMTAEVAGTL